MVAASHRDAPRVDESVPHPPPTSPGTNQSTRPLSGIVPPAGTALTHFQTHSSAHIPDTLGRGRARPRRDMFINSHGLRAEVCSPLVSSPPLTWIQGVYPPLRECGPFLSDRPSPSFETVSRKQSLAIPFPMGGLRVMVFCCFCDPCKLPFDWGLGFPQGSWFWLSLGGGCHWCCFF